MDIAKLKPAERIIEIIHPATGENVGIRVTVISLVDERMKAVRRRFQNKKIELEKRGKTFKADDLEENATELLLNAITGWDWYDAEFNGEKPVFNEKNVKTVLNEFSWFKNQIVEAIDDEKAFFQS
nr:MAG TPA: hypothetical protein [Caudoviricetes sp.]